MPPFVRLGCAGVAVITIAALTSVGLFALVAGRSPFGAAAGRAAASGAPVLVTIQALPVTPTVAPLPTATEMPTSLIPALAAPPRTVAAATTAAPPAPTPAVPPAPTPAALASPAPQIATAPAALAAPTAAERSATHDGLTLEVAEVDRHWQPAPGEGAAASREPTELLTVHLRFVNRTGDVRYVAESDILLAGSDGARFAARHAGTLREPRLLTVPLAPNDSLRGWLTYEIPPNTAVRGIQWSPTRPDRPRAEATYIVGLPQ